MTLEGNQTPNPSDTPAVVDTGVATPPLVDAVTSGVIAITGDVALPNPYDGVPESFLKDGKLDIEALAALNEANSVRAAAIPADGNYQIKLDEALKDAEGKPVQIDLESPAAQTLLAAAKELKLTPDEVNKFASQMVAMEYERAKVEEQAVRDQVQKELSKLGANPEGRITAVLQGLKAQLGDEADAFLGVLPTSAEAVRAAEKILSKLISTSPNPALINDAQKEQPLSKIFYPNM